MAGTSVGSPYNVHKVSLPEEVVKGEWKFLIYPAYRRVYPNGDFPDEIYIVDHLVGYNGEGGPGIVSISKDAAAMTETSLRIFVLAHETGHCVVPLECQRQQIHQPSVVDDSGKKSNEYLADLIGMRVLKEMLPNTVGVVTKNYGLLAQELGPGHGDHPDGGERTRMMKLYTDGTKTFEDLFRKAAAGQAF